MTVQLLNPAGIVSVPTHHQVAVATGSRQIFLAGQVGWNEAGELVAADLAGQLAQAFRNVGTALAAAGATFDDVVRMTIYVTDWSVEKMPDFIAGRQQVADELQLTLPPASLIGVSVLYEPGILVEIEAIAVVD